MECYYRDCSLVSRVPMNVMTCGALLCLHVETISQDKRIVFGACFALCIFGKGHTTIVSSD